MRLLFLCSILPTAVLHAQEVSIRALTEISAVAESGGKQILKTSPVGTTRSSHKCPCGNFVVDANRGSSAGSASVSTSAGAKVSFFEKNKPVQVDVSSSITLLGDGTGFITPAKSVGNAKPGPIDYLVTFTAAKTVKGVISLNYSGWLKNPGAKGVTRVDLGNNNSVDFVGDLSKATPAQARFPVDFKNGPIVLKITMEASSPKAASRSNAQAMSQSLRLKLLKTGSCSLVTYGKSCGGASLGAGLLTLGNDSIVATKLVGGVKNGFAARVVGSTRINTLLPGGCPLLAEPLIVELFRADASGSFTETFKLPAGMNFTATFQYVPIDLVGNAIKASSTNAFELTCSGF